MVVSAAPVHPVGAEDPDPVTVTYGGGPTVTHVPVPVAYHGEPIPVRADVDCADLSPCEATLLYRSTSVEQATDIVVDGSFTAAAMLEVDRIDVPDGRDVVTFEGTVPGTAVGTTGVDYAIEATQDGQTASASPAYWHVTTVSPPLLSHIPPPLGRSGEDLELTLQSSCSTPSCTATMHYRTTDGPLIDEPLLETPDWPSVEMELVSTTLVGDPGDLLEWRASIPGGAVDTRGVDYFFEVTDNEVTSWWPGTVYQGHYAPTDGMRTGYHHTHVLEPSHVVHAPVIAAPYRSEIEIQAAATCPIGASCTGTLYYRTTTRSALEPAAGFVSAPMDLTPVGSPVEEQQPVTVTGTIPSEFTDTRGVDYFFSVTDDATTAWWPGTSHVDGYVPVEGQRVGYHHTRIQDPPHIVPVPVGPTTFGTTTAVSAAVSCATELCTATLHYTSGLINDPLAPVAFTSVTMERTGVSHTPLGALDTWSAEIPGQDVTTQHLSYYIEVDDGYVTSYSPGTSYWGAYVPMDGQRLADAEVALNGISVGVGSGDATVTVGSSASGSSTNQLAGLTYPIWVQEPPHVVHMPHLVVEEQQELSVEATVNCATPNCVAVLEHARNGEWATTTMNQQVVEDGATSLGRILALSASIPRSDVVAGLSYRITVDDGYTSTTTLTYPVQTQTLTDVNAVGDKIWFDVDADGTIDASEPFAIGVEVTLESAGIDGLFGTIDDLPSRTQETDYRGTYRFNQLAPGKYRVRIDLPAGASLVSPPPQEFSVGVMNQLLSIDIGIRWDGVVSGVVFGDADGDGVRDGDETGVAGRSVYAMLRTDADPPVVTDRGLAGFATTAADGSYTIVNLPPGEYWVKVDDVVGDDVLNADVGTTSPWVDAEITTTAPTASADFGRTANDDADSDGLARGYEQRISTDPSLADTDGDGLLDGFEVRAGDLLSPVAADTDGDGVADGDEDLDGDGLTNLEEQTHGSSPLSPDTDDDGLDDPAEILAGTDPGVADTDDDTLADGREIEVGLDPTSPDSDGDGIVDPDDRLTSTVTSSDGVTIEIVGVGDLAGEASIVEVGTGAASGIAGQVSPAYAIRLSGGEPFDSATITIPVPETLPPGVAASDLRMLRLNEETGTWLPFDSTQTLDPTAGTLTATTEHFSIYALFEPTGLLSLTQQQLYPCAPRTDQDGNRVYYDIALIIDSSGSMTWNDPNDLRKGAAISVIDSLQATADDADRAAIIDFDSVGRVAAPLTADQAALRAGVQTIDSAGGTSLAAGVSLGLQELEKSDAPRVGAAILLTDGDGPYDHRLSEQAKERGIPIFTVALGEETNPDLLKAIAYETNAGFYNLRYPEELDKVFQHIADSLYRLGPDADDDGLTDCEEVRGIAVTNGTTYFTEPIDPDTDGDGLLDGEEIGPFFYWHNPIFAALDLSGEWEAFHDNAVFARRAFSDPTTPHSDDDGLDDYDEAIYETDAFDADSDDDLIDDDEELHWETDPNNPNTDGDRGSAELEDRAEVENQDFGFFPWVQDRTWSDWVDYAAAVQGGLGATRSALAAGRYDDGTGAWFNGFLAGIGADFTQAGPVDSEVLDLAAGGPIFPSYLWSSVLGGTFSEIEHPSDNLALFSFEHGEFPNTGTDGDSVSENVGGSGFYDPRGFSDAVIAAVRAFPEQRLQFLSIAMRTRIPRDQFFVPAWAIAEGVDPAEYLLEEKTKVLQEMYPESMPILLGYGFSESALQRLAKSRRSIVSIVELINMPNHRSPQEGLPEAPFFGRKAGTRHASGKQAVEWYVRNRFGTAVPRETKTQTPEGGRFPDYRENATGGERWHEVKSGYVSASHSLSEVRKDKSAVTNNPPIAIGAHWNFFASGISNSIGAYTPLRKQLDQLDPNLEFVFTVYPTVDADYVPPTTRLIPL